MKIYLVRHEDRTQDCTFFSPLTKKGLENSIILKDKLKELDINVIYSSPFIRTLQTVYPYSISSGNKINIDYSLAEIQLPDLIPPNSYKVKLPKYLEEKFNYNPNYTSLINPIDYKYPENANNLHDRVKKILKKIISNNARTQNNILLVTHQGVCDTILKIILKNGFKLDNSQKIKYPKGGLTKIFDDNKWSFKPYNWEI
jgi:2,3-bisphosphoglycerate-dependent phosphoglycerate mutase